MAYINVSMSELVTLIEKNGNYDKNRIKRIDVINQGQLELTINIGQFFPDIKVGLMYNRLEKGRMYFNILSSGGVKMLMGLLSEMSNKSGSNYIVLEKNSMVFDMNKMLSSNIQGLNVRDVNMTGEQIYISVDIK